MQESRTLFEDNFPSISREQYSEAAILAKKLRAIISKRDAGSNNNFTDPNYIWEPIKVMSYCFDPTYEVVNTWRLHTYLFPGNSLLPYICAYHNAIPKTLVKKYQRKVAWVPDEYIFRPPRIMAECGWEINGGIVNDETLMYQKHVSTLYFEGVIEKLRSIKNPKILEIGGGYGGLAYFLKKLVPHARYYMVDLAESLIFSSIYLQIASPGAVDPETAIYDGANKDVLNPAGNHFTFIPNFLVRDPIGKTGFDLVINTGSFGEMKKEQVQEYADVISKLLAPTGFLYEENHDKIYDDLSYLKKGTSSLSSVNDILAAKFSLFAANGRRKLWYGNEAAVQAIMPFKNIVKEKDRKAYSHWTFEQNISRIVQRLPKVKATIKSFVGR